MGKNRRRRGNKEAPRRSRKNYKDIVRENKWYEEYYKEQSCIPTEEFEQFMTAMKEPLPAVFRLTGYKKHAKQLLKNMKDNIFKDLVEIKLKDEVINMPYTLKWYPDDLAWQTSLNRTQIRSIPELEKFHNFLITEAESGHITRQEAVSMIPPLLLDVQPSHKVLDLCAAPGSKTAQIIELLHADENNHLPSGLCIANDKDNKRCYMLTHQTNRLNSPVSMIVNHDAVFFPDLTIKDKDGNQALIKYDRVLADVPCSGDGTMRKNFDVWTKWSVNNAIHLHNVQIRIIQRGLEVLATGGRLVYSTCSLNPVEDEAVVASMIAKSDGAVELVNVATEMPELKWCKGVSSWKVQGRDKTWYNKFEDLPENLNYLRPTMFPPESSSKLNLDRCLRLLPHQQDTGGFFVAVLRKIKPLPWEKDEDLIFKNGQPPPKKVRLGPNTFKESPFVFFEKEETEILPSLKSFYGLNKDFPSEQLLSRNLSEKKRHLYFVSSLVKNVMENNKENLKVINTGVRVFSRCDNHKAKVDCDYRLVQDGSDCIEPFMTKRVVNITSIDDIAVLLSNDQPDYDDLSNTLKDTLADVTVGSMMYKYSPKTSDDPITCDLLMSAWRGGRSTRLYMCRFERAHFLNMIGRPVPDDLKPNKNTRRKRANNGNTEESEDVLELTDNLKNPIETKIEEKSIDDNSNDSLHISNITEPS